MSCPRPFHLPSRTPLCNKLNSETYDLVIIGGGITGAGIALDAVTRGLKVALLEKGDFASGTSSKSTKLIHGGLRYLKQFDFWLVKEVGSERSVVHKIAPHLVIPEKMLLPLVEKGTYGKWLTSVGLKVYDVLADVSGPDQRRMLEKDEALEIEPLLPKDILKGAGYYAEYRTDDARLTIEVIKTAVSHGADVLNYACVQDFLYAEGKVVGVIAKDLESGQELQLRANAVVNATGPWVDTLRNLNNSLSGKQLYLTKGVHLVFPHHKLPVQQAVYFDVPDGRMIFAIPRGRVTYVGTTDTPYKKSLVKPITDLADAIYLLTAVNHMFPEINLELGDIESSWAGLRPLIYEEGKTASELSRKDEIFISDTGLISIAGGKLTGYRKMAERVTDHVIEVLQEAKNKFGPCRTERLTLVGGDFRDYREVLDYREDVRSRLTQRGTDARFAEYLVATYGMQTDAILEDMESRTDKDPELRLLLCELAYGLQHEFVRTPMDFWIRRTGRMYFNLPTVRKYRERVNKIFEESCGIPEGLVKQWDQHMEDALKEHSDFSVDRDKINLASH